MLDRLHPLGRSARSAPVGTLLLALTALAVLAWPRTSPAQSFPLTLPFATAGTQHSVAAGDLNGDGRLDLVAGNYYNNTVSVLLGAGGGSFGTRTTFATGSNPRWLALGDLDLDGRLDLVVANMGSNFVSVLLGTGTGGFGAKNDWAVGNGPSSLAIGDLDGDGKPDVVVTNQYSGTASVLLGDGAGGFASRTDLTTGSGPTSVAIGDLDGDEVPDLAVANYGPGSVSVLLGQGAGRFASRTDYAAGGGSQGVAIGDVSGDGALDLVVANSTAASVSVLPGDGHGGFGAKTDFATGASPLAVAIGDLTSDGRADLAVACNSSSCVSVLPGNGSGSFSGEADFAGANPAAIAIADLNGDGRNDMAVANTNSSSLYVLLAGGGAGWFQPKVDFTTGNHPNSIIAADLNADGKKDLAAVNYNSNSVSVLLGNGAGGFGPKTDFATGSIPNEAAAADLNRDGRLDLAVVNKGSNTVSILLGDGVGGFGTRTDYAVGNLPWGVAAGDVNGDGNPDVVTANAGANTVSVLLGNGTGVLGPRTDFATNAFPISVAIGELNGDGKPDLVVANNGASSVSVLLGTGTGGFATLAEFSTCSAPVCVRLDDLNGDGRLDLAVASNSTNAVSVLMGTGIGSFGTRTDYATATPSWAVAIGDVNGDSRPDLTLSNSSTSSVSVLLNGYNGAIGSFTPKIDFATGGGPAPVTISDLNSDGRSDLVVGYMGTSFVSVFLSFAPSYVALASTPNPVAPGSAVTLTATVTAVPPATGTPQGGVSFFDGFTLLGSQPLSGGTASYKVFPAGFGAHPLTAVYGGSATFLGHISDALTQLVTAPAGSPVVTAVADVPNDQGGKVKLSWSASPFDAAPDYVVSTYWILRSVPPNAMARALDGGARRLSSPGERLADGRRNFLVTKVAGVEYAWEYLASQVAFHTAAYSYLATTTGDSVAGSNPLTAFMVEARTEDGRWWFSAPDSGYSVDDLAPAQPAPFVGQFGTGETALHWGMNGETDLLEYRLYRGEESNFVPGPANLVAATRDTGFVDHPPVDVAYYKLCAVDVHGNRSHYALTSLMGPTPTLTTLVRAECRDGVVRLLWCAAANPGLAARLERQTVEGGWSRLAVLTADEDGFLSYLDAAVTPGGRYGYRLAIEDAGVVGYYGEAWVEVPRLALALHGARPNPATRDLAVSFELPDAAPARLDAFDLAGRRIAGREVGSLGPGAHVVSLAEGRGLAPGIYLLRLTRGAATIVTRAVVLE